MEETREEDSASDTEYTPFLSEDTRTIELSETNHDEGVHDDKRTLFDKNRSSSESKLELLQTESDSDSETSSISDASEKCCLIGWEFTRSQKIAFWATTICDFLAYLSLSLMAPFFPEEALKKNVSDTLSGWIFGIAPLTVCLISPVVGKIMPFLGVKNLFFFGILLFGSCTFLFGFLTFIPASNYRGLFIASAFILQVSRSVGVATSSTASFVLWIQEFPDDFSTAFGIGEIFVGLGMMIGPGIGGVLYGLGGFSLPFIAVGSLAILSVPCMVWSMTSLKTVAVDYRKENLPARKVLFSPRGILISACIIFGTAVWTILDPTLEPHLRQPIPGYTGVMAVVYSVSTPVWGWMADGMFSLSPEILGVIFLVMAVVYSVSAPVWGWMADRMDDQRLFLSAGFLFACIGSLLVGPSPLLSFAFASTKLWLVIVSLVILGASVSLCTVPTFDMYFSLAQDLGYEDDIRTYSMVSGLWMAMYSFGDFIGPTIGGALSNWIGFSNMCSYMAAVCLLMALILAANRLCSCNNCHQGGYSIHRRLFSKKTLTSNNYVPLQTM